jgi:hypothetical protein
MKKLVVLFLFISFGLNAQIFPWMRQRVDTIQEVALPITNVIAIMGQSNIDGRNSLDSLNILFTNPTSKINVASSGSFIDYDVTSPTSGRVAPTSQYSADLLAGQMISDSLGESIIYIKKSRGGTSFFPGGIGNGDWNINTVGSLYDQFITGLNSTKSIIEFNGNQMGIKALWMDIGESDSGLNTQQGFIDMATDFINEIRVYAQNDTLPVIWRELNLSSAGVSQPFLDAQDIIATRYPYVYIVEGDGHTLFDSSHLDSLSTRNYANSVRDILLPIYRNDVVPLSKLEIIQLTETIAVGDSLQLRRKVIPFNATDKTGLWSSSNDAIATVDQFGMVKGVSSGTATITLTPNDINGSADTFTAKIGTSSIAVTGVTVSPNSVSVDEGSTSQLSVSFEPINATDQTGTWSSDTPAVATVSSSGLVTGVSDGSAIITFTSNDGSFTDTCNVTVNATVSGNLIVNGTFNDNTGVDDSNSNTTVSGGVLTHNGSGFPKVYIDMNTSFTGAEDFEISFDVTSGEIDIRFGFKGSDGDEVLSTAWATQDYGVGSYVISEDFTAGISSEYNQLIILFRPSTGGSIDNLVLNLQ